LLNSLIANENQSWQVTSEAQQKFAEKLLATFQGIPLLIVAVAAIAIRQTCTIQESVEAYQKLNVSDLASGVETPRGRSSRLKPEELFDRAINRLEAGSRTLMGMLAFFNGNYIAREFIFGSKTKRDPELSFLHFGNFAFKDIHHVLAEIMSAIIMSRVLLLCVKLHSLPSGYLCCQLDQPLTSTHAQSSNRRILPDSKTSVHSFPHLNSLASSPD